MHASGSRAASSIGPRAPGSRDWTAGRRVGEIDFPEIRPAEDAKRYDARAAVCHSGEAAVGNEACQLGDRVGELTTRERHVDIGEAMQCAGIGRICSRSAELEQVGVGKARDRAVGGGRLGLQEGRPSAACPWRRASWAPRGQRAR